VVNQEPARIAIPPLPDGVKAYEPCDFTISLDKGSKKNIQKTPKWIEEMSTYQRNSGNPFQELLQHASQLDSPLHQALEYPKSEARKEFFGDIADQLTKRFGEGPLTPNREEMQKLGEACTDAAKAINEAGGLATMKSLTEALSCEENFQPFVSPHGAIDAADRATADEAGGTGTPGGLASAIADCTNLLSIGSTGSIA
jgi:hypothetical protein